MKIAVKKTDFEKINLKEIETLFNAIPIDAIEYNSSELTKTLNEIIFEFNYSHKDTFPKYLKDRLVTGRILQ